MFAKAWFSPLATLAVWATLSANGSCGLPMTVSDENGRTIDIQLVSFFDDSVTFSRKGDTKEFTLPITRFSQASQELIRLRAAQIPAAVAKIQPDVIIGNRRQKGRSYYMVKQEVTCSVKLTNTSLHAAVPASNGRIIFLGQDRRRTEQFVILSTQGFEFSIAPGKVFAQEMESFTTSYDGENKGTDNVGGFQYIGNILVATDDAGKVILSQASTGSLRQSIEANQGVLTDLVSYKKGQLLTDKLAEAKGTAIFLNP